MGNYSPPPGLRPPKDAAFTSNPLITLTLPQVTISERARARGVTLREIDHAFALQGSQTLIENPDAWRKALMKDKGLFIKTLAKLVASEGFHFNPNLQFRTIQEGVTGSSTILCVRIAYSYAIEKFSPGGGSSFIGPGESTTRYKARFGFVNYSGFKNAGFAAPAHGVSSPVYSLDADLISKIQENKKGKEILPGLAEDFWKLLAMSEHDYIHALTLSRHSAGVFDSDKPSYYGQAYEEWSLALHATVCNELFKNKKRKDAYLVWVQNYFDKVIQIQNALGAASGAREIITYLAEIGFQRVVRVMSPDDKDFAASKAAQLMEQLQLLQPRKMFFLKPFARRKYEESSALEKLWAHCAHISGPSYRKYKTIFKPLHAPNLRFNGFIKSSDQCLATFKAGPVRILGIQHQFIFGDKDKLLKQMLG